MSVYLQKGLSAGEAQLFFNVYSEEDRYARNPSAAAAKKLTEAYGKLGNLLERSDSFQDGASIGIRFPQLLPTQQTAEEPIGTPVPARKVEKDIFHVSIPAGVLAYA